MSFDRVAEIVANTAHCKVDDVNPETKLETLGIDSLKAITLLFELEEAFDIHIPNESIPTITTVGDIMDRLEAVHTSSA